MQTTQDPLAAIEAELARQDAEWTRVRERLDAFRDADLFVEGELSAAFDDATSLAAVGNVPLGLIRL